MSAEQDRAASLLVSEVVDLVGHLAATGASLRRLIAGSATGATGAGAREPAAPSGPRNAASEAPAGSTGSPLATRVLTALMDMPDAQFLAMANKVLNRYYAAVVALAPEGVSAQVQCIHCGKVGAHRVCDACFTEHGPGPQPVHNVWASNCVQRTDSQPIDNERCEVCG